MIGLRKIIAKAVANGKWIKDRTTNIDVEEEDDEAAGLIVAAI